MKKKVEAALFTAGKPVSLSKLAKLTDKDKSIIKRSLKQLKKEYNERDTALEIIKIKRDKYVMQVSPEYAEGVRNLAPKELSDPLLRTLSVIAYRQPVTQSEVVEIRGNTAYSHVKKLEELDLVETEPHGRTKLLKTTSRFAEYFGFKSSDPEKVKKLIEERIDDEEIEEFL